MQDEELIQKIKQLKNVMPDENWVISCRSKLAFRMEMERKQNLLNKDLFTLKELFSFWQNPQFVFKAVYSFVLIVAVVLGGGALTVFGAMNSLPGSSLYPIKIAMEKAQLGASSSENKIKLQAEMTDRRIQELNTVVGSQDSLEQKSEKIGVVVSQLQDQLATAKNDLPKVFNAAEPKKMADAARTMGEKAEQVEKTLARVKEILPSDIKQNMSDKLSAVAETANKTSAKAIELMANSEEVDKKEVAAKVGSRIQQTEEKIKIVGQKIGNSSATSTSDKLPITAVLIDQSEKAQKLVEEAKSNLVNNNVSAAMETLKAATEIVNSTEKIADNVISDSNLKANQEIKESVGNATTSTVQGGVENKGK